MYETAKKAREALKSKARRLATDKYEKVSSSDWTPPAPLNADAKTGMRPVSRRAYKSGGAVEGSCGAMRADRKPRKAGGKAESEKAEAKQYANAKVNRDVKSANEEREGVKHIGGLKKGGRAKKEEGGSIGSMIENMDKAEAKSQLPARGPMPPKRPADRTPAVTAPKETTRPPHRGYQTGDDVTGGSGSGGIKAVRKEGGRTKKKDGGDVDVASLVGLRPVWKTKPAVSQLADNMKKGGRTKKQMGGGMFNPAATMGMGAQPMNPQPDPRQNIVNPNSMNFIGNPVTPGVSGMKKGGKVARKDGGKIPHAEWEHSKKDLVEDKKLAKKHGMSLEQWEKSAADKKHDKQQSMKGLEKPKKAIGGILGKSGLGGLLPMAMNAMRDDDDKKAKGGRTARKDGGRTKSKGKTNIAIVINAGEKAKAPGSDMGMPPLPPGGADALPIPVPPKGPMPAGAAPMPMPMPMPAPGGMPPMPPMGGAGPAPMMRKDGGRITKKASSYKDMEAGAASGEGRLQKTDIAAKLPKPGLKRGVIESDNKGYPNKVNGAVGGRTAKKAGGRTYRSYKDMDAGAGSGFGRLEKTEIASRSK